MNFKVWCGQHLLDLKESNSRERNLGLFNAFSIPVASFWRNTSCRRTSIWVWNNHRDIIEKHVYTWDKGHGKKPKSMGDIFRKVSGNFLTEKGASPPPLTDGKQFFGGFLTPNMFIVQGKYHLLFPYLRNLCKHHGGEDEDDAWVWLHWDPFPSPIFW